MKILTELIPVFLFFGAYQVFDIYVATGVLMAAMVVQIAWFKLVGRPVERMHKIGLVLVLGLGALTLAFRNPLFLMWKPTVINWLFAAALLLSARFMQRGILQRMLDTVAAFPATVVQRLNLAWAGFLVLLGVLNLAVAYNFSEAIWVDFKLFGLMGLTLLFALGQGFYLARHMPQNTAAATGAATEE